MKRLLDKRPIIVAIAGPNGAGKSTFFEAFLQSSALRFINADAIALELGIDPYEAAAMAARIRDELVLRKESFIFETVFSDPMGEKVAFLKNAAEQGYTVVLCFIGLDSPDTSETRVAMRISQGGHDVPCEKLRARFPRILVNLKRAIQLLPVVFIYDNSDMAIPFRIVAKYHNGVRKTASNPLPAWFSDLA